VPGATGEYPVPKKLANNFQKNPPGFAGGASEGFLIFSIFI
jgi:hypothetical protein